MVLILISADARKYVNNALRMQLRESYVIFEGIKRRTRIYKRNDNVVMIVAIHLFLLNKPYNSVYKAKTKIRKQSEIYVSQRRTCNEISRKSEPCDNFIT